ncbi:MAG: zinc ribbon domain-containing protein [Firmicutes bacterium]|nr:zinc ribbon domain-containing protein [Bacillota bacterium]
MIERELFSVVQERLKENQYFLGKNSAKEIYLLTGKAFCGHCGTPMVSDGGNGRLGTTYHYYACKKMKKRCCDKKREDKERLERNVIEFLRDFLSESNNVEKAASDVLAYYEKRTSDDGLRSLEVRITKARQDVENWAEAFVNAKSQLLRDSIETKMQDLEMLLSDLLTQKSKLELERGYKLTKADIMDFVAELLKGNPADKEYQRKLINNLLSTVYVYDDCIIGYFNIKPTDGTKLQTADLTETNEAVEEVMCSNFIPTPSANSEKSEL